MPVFPSSISLHLQYRIWIAEMNLDINLLRIYNDYIPALQTKDKELLTEVTRLEQLFAVVRNEIDVLKNDMHLLKMKLGTYVREKKVLDHRTYQSDNHISLKKRYQDFRKKFNKLKKELEDLVKKVLR